MSAFGRKQTFTDLRNPVLEITCVIAPVKDTLAAGKKFEDFTV
jgi:hypothetical protein